MSSSPPRRLAVILHADVVDSTTLVQLNETVAHERIRDAFVQFSKTIGAYGGVTLELRGDALLAEFARASDAVCAALAFQLASATFNNRLSGEIQARLRIGLSLGEVVVADKTMTGAGVVLAQRLEQLAPAGGVVAQGAVCETVPTRLPFDYNNLGEQQLKGFDQPVRAFLVSLKPGACVPLPESAPEPVADSGKPRASHDTEIPDKPSVAVLPFENLSNDPEQEYFADGITEDIITALGRIRQFFVINRNTMFSYKGQSWDVKAVAMELGVRYLLEGSVRKAGNRVRVSAQLVEGLTGNQLWAERYDRDLEDIFSVQDEITGNVVSAIEPALTRAEWGRAKTKNPENLDAWDCVVRAIALITEFSDKDSAQAMRLLEQAIALDPKYARAYGHKAWLAIWRAFQGWGEMATAIEKATTESGRAIQLDVNEPWSYIARAYVGLATRDADLSVSSSRKAIELSPSFAYGHSVLGLASALAGRGVDGLAEIELAMRLSPRDIWREEFELHYAFAQFQIANYQEAARFAESASLPQPGHVYPQLVLMASHGHLGQIRNAQQVVQRLENHVPGFSLTAASVAQLFIRDEDHGRMLDGLKKAGVVQD
ncbi:MAG: adenylate cyclase [Gammaproteobacteria bacterium]|jgi:adenylate cyclase